MPFIDGIGPLAPKHIEIVLDKTLGPMDQVFMRGNVAIGAATVGQTVDWRVIGRYDKIKMGETVYEGVMRSNKSTTR